MRRHLLKGPRFQELGDALSDGRKSLDPSESTGSQPGLPCLRVCLDDAKRKATLFGSRLFRNTHVGGRFESRFGIVSGRWQVGCVKKEAKCMRDPWPCAWKRQVGLSECVSVPVSKSAESEIQRVSESVN